MGNDTKITELIKPNYVMFSITLKIMIPQQKNTQALTFFKGCLIRDICGTRQSRLAHQETMSLVALFPALILA
jgi:hypothetical protein